MTKEQAEALAIAWRYDYEEQVRGVYRTQSPLDATSSTAMSSMAACKSNPLITAIPTHTEQDASHDLDAHNDHKKLYQERLVANKIRIDREVTIANVETETARVSVPIEKKRVVIERAPATLAVPGSVNFGEGEVARINLLRVLTFIKKHLYVKKSESTKWWIRKRLKLKRVRREELDVNTDGRPVVDRSDRI